MGNRLGLGRKTAKVMKIDGEIFKLKTPVRVWEAIKDYPGHVLIESEAFKNFGIRAKPLKPERALRPKKLYLLMEIPKLSRDGRVRRVQSGINMSAVDRLESLMLSRSSVSDLSEKTITFDESEGASNGGAAIRVQLRLPKSQLMKLMEESKDNDVAAEKIMELCMEKAISNIHGANAESHDLGLGNWKPGPGIIRETPILDE